MAETYRAALGERAGTVVVMREAWIDESPDPETRFAPVIGPVFEYYRREGAAEIPAAFGDLAADRFVVGGAEACASQVEAIAESTGADAVALTIRHPGGPAHAAAVAAIAALGRAWARIPAGDRA